MTKRHHHRKQSKPDHHVAKQIHPPVSNRSYIPKVAASAFSFFSGIGLANADHLFPGELLRNKFSVIANDQTTDYGLHYDGTVYDNLLQKLNDGACGVSTNITHNIPEWFEVIYARATDYELQSYIGLFRGEAQHAVNYTEKCVEALIDQAYGAWKKDYDAEQRLLDIEIWTPIAAFVGITAAAIGIVAYCSYRNALRKQQAQQNIESGVTNKTEKTALLKNNEPGDQEVSAAGGFINTPDAGDGYQAKRLR